MTASRYRPQAAPDPAAVERAVLATLTGNPLEVTARKGGITSAALATASRAYQRAGRAALAADTDPVHMWDQIILEFADWDCAEHTAATILAPRLQRAEVASGWWFIRKHPHWRIRYRPTADLDPAQTRDRVSVILDDLTATGVLRSWRHGIYEPEILAFGGPAGITIAHDLFCADSLGVLTTYGDATTSASGSCHSVGRKELSVLLCTALMRNAHLDWFEQGDTWHRIASLRPAPAAAGTDKHHTAIKTLLAADTTPTSPLLTSDGPLTTAADWISGFRLAGQALSTAANAGDLHRGLRDVLAHLIIFHWNRLGLTITAQATLARAAQDVIMNTAGSSVMTNSR